MRLALLTVTLCAASAYVIAFGLGEGRPGVYPLDVYGYFYPNILHALPALAAGGGGLLWNPFQNCGQPFFGIATTGLYYPLNVLFLALEPQTALRGLLLANLAIGGLGVYGLGRQLGMSGMAALGAALAFILGNSAYHVTKWTPTVQAPYVWMPVAMLYCERLVKAPTLRSAVLLGGALAIALLPGHPQFVAFTCQLIALRLLWALFDRCERRQLLRSIAGVGLAMSVMLLLTAAQLFPSSEVVGESVRRTSLSLAEIQPMGVGTLRDVAQRIRLHDSLAPFNLVPGFLVAIAIAHGSHRRVALFYFLAGALFLFLSLGVNNPIAFVYYQMPFSNLFRVPIRLVFVTGFCVSVLAGLALDVLAAGSWRPLAVAAAGLLGLFVWLENLPALEWGLAGLVLGAGLLAATVPAARPLSAAVMVGTIAFTPILIPNWSIVSYLADDAPLRAHADVFERLRGRLTPQDRAYFGLPATREPGFQEKSAMLFHVRSVTDYELQLSRRYAEYSTMLRRSEPLHSVNQVYYPGVWSPRTVSWPLVHLAAARYVVVHRSHRKELAAVGRAHLKHLDGDGEITVYANRDALPRSYYVPQIAVVSDAESRLRRLASSGGNRRILALVDAAPPSGFLGMPGNEATADAQFVVDDAERVVLETVAPERGFLFLADQHFPGWSATVNGQPTPILAANHAFRLVEVPPGPVTVEFRYRSPRVWIGALISGVTLLVAMGVLVAPYLRAWKGVACAPLGNSFLST